MICQIMGGAELILMKKEDKWKSDKSVSVRILAG